MCCCEDLVRGGGTAGETGGDVEEVFVEDFDAWEAGMGCCCEFFGEVVDPGALEGVLVVVREGGWRNLRPVSGSRLLVCRPLLKGRSLGLYQSRR